MENKKMAKYNINLLSTSLLENARFFDINNMKIMKFIGFRNYQGNEHLVFAFINKIKNRKKPTKQKIITNVSVIYSLNVFNKLTNEGKILCL